MKKAQLKLSTFIAASTSIVVLLCMVVLVLVLNKNVSNSMMEAASDTLQTGLGAQSIALNDYMKSAERVLKEFSSSFAVRDYLHDPGNQEKQTIAQEYTERFYHNLEGWEAIWVADWDTAVLLHSNPSGVGTTLRSNLADIESYRKDMTKQPDDLYNAGAITSSVSNEMVLSLRMVVKDEDGTPIGIIGGGPYIRELTDSLNSMVIEGMETSQYVVLDARQNI